MDGFAQGSGSFDRAQPSIQISIRRYEESGIGFGPYVGWQAFPQSIWDGKRCLDDQGIGRSDFTLGRIPSRQQSIGIVQDGIVHSGYGDRTFVGVGNGNVEMPLGGSGIHAAKGQGLEAIDARFQPFSGMARAAHQESQANGCEDTDDEGRSIDFVSHGK